MAIAERVLERGPSRLPRNIQIASLERQLHERRVAIKGLLASFEMYKVLATNGLMAETDFVAQRRGIFAQINTLGHQQRVTRKELRPLKRATEKKKESPFNEPRTPQFSESGGVVFHERKTIGNRRKADHRPEDPALMEQLAILWKMRKSRQLTRREYTELHRALLRRPR